MAGENSKILVVDDEAVIRELMIDILTDEGYNVESAPNAFEALNLLREDSDIVLLFTDIMMPKMTGIELIREARLISPSLIPIVMTGYATLESARAAVKEGAYDYVLKPFSLSEIKLVVANALERHQLATENARLRDLTELFIISETIATFHKEQALLDFVLKAALSRVGAERGSVMVTTPDGSALEMASSVGVQEEFVGTHVQMGAGISGWVAEHGKALVVEDIGRNPDLKEMSRKLQDASFISVPLERKLTSEQQGRYKFPSQQPKVLAVLNVNRKQSGGFFTEGDLKILSIVANHAAVALENVRLIRTVDEAHLSTIKSMALALEARDPYTHGHSERVRNFSVMAAMKLGMSQRDVETLRLGAMLHDVGKIGVKDEILNKVERLSDDEWQQIKLHPVIGYDVLEPVGFLSKDHLSLIRSHHERIDGTGYPDGLSGDQLDDRVRVIAVADTYDAMSSNRAYRQGLSPDRVVTELKRCSGVGLDTRITDLFIGLIESGEIHRYETEEPTYDE